MVTRAGWLGSAVVSGQTAGEADTASDSASASASEVDGAGDGGVSIPWRWDTECLTQLELKATHR